jgi:glucose-1-phosphate thymidylyltransferase
MKKAILLAGGFGIRMLPATLKTNKGLLPVYSKEGAVPFLYYPIHTLKSSGFDKILIVSSQEHCGDIIEHFGDGYKFGVDFTYKIQDMNNPKKPIGIAGALKLAKDFVGDDRFAVILGDNFFEEIFLSQSSWFDDSQNLAHLFLKEVEDVNRFGCAEIEDGKITRIVEKPKCPLSNLAVTGLYFFTAGVFEELDKLVVSSRDELEISDINDYYVLLGKAGHTILDGFWSDTGVPLTMVKTHAFIIKNNYKILDGLL